MRARVLAVVLMSGLAASACEAVPLPTRVQPSWRAGGAEWSQGFIATPVPPSPGAGGAYRSPVPGDGGAGAGCRQRVHVARGPVQGAVPGDAGRGAEPRPPDLRHPAAPP